MIYYYGQSNGGPFCSIFEHYSPLTAAAHSRVQIYQRVCTMFDVRLILANARGTIHHSRATNDNQHIVTNYRATGKLSWRLRQTGLFSLEHYCGS